MAEALYSWLAGCLDNGYYLQRAIYNKHGPVLFKHGWGDITAVYDAYQPLLRRLEDGSTGLNVLYHGAGTATELAVEWTQATHEHHAKHTSAEVQRPNSAGPACGCRCRSKKTHPQPDQAGPQSALVIRQGSFLSPQAGILPDEAKQCRFLYVAPEGCSGHWQPWEARPSGSPEAREVIIMLPATGEQGYGDRLHLARSLVKSRGAVCILVMAPLYASRKPSNQKGAFPTTVGLYLAQSLAIMSEGAALAVWANKRWPEARLCLTGFSWGAAMSACAGMLAAAALTPQVSSKVLSVAPYVGASSPAPVVDGILAGDMAWPRLLAECEHGARQLTWVDGLDYKALASARDPHSGKGMVAVRNALYDLLSEFNNTYFTDRLKTRYGGTIPALFASMSSTITRHDWFLARQYAMELHEALEAISVKGKVQLTELLGGHVLAFKNRLVHQVRSVHWALDHAGM